VALMAEHVGIFICGFGFGERGKAMENDAESGRDGWVSSCTLSLRGKVLQPRHRFSHDARVRTKLKNGATN
jgi:hypothetical protein